jgi:RNA polymerase sigma-70 factor (sigma-E family)
MMKAEVEAVRIEGGRLAELYRLHIDQAFRLAYLLTADRELARDLAQDAFVRLTGRLLHLRRPGDFQAYLRTTVVNLANSHFRRRRVERGYLRRQSELRQLRGDDRDLEVKDQLQRALLALPVRQRTAIVLRFYEDLSETQTAELMRCRTGTVRSLVSRGMQTLRTDLKGARDG